MAAMTTALPMIMQGAGTALSVAGQLRQGRANQAAANANAAELERSAGQQQASAQRAAMERQREGRIAASRALAVAAASGGGASDPTVVNIMAQLAGESTYRSMVELYQGDEKAQNMRRQATVDRQFGESSNQSARYGALSTALSGATSMYSKYGLNQPDK